MTETLSSPKSTSTHSSLQRQLSKKHRHATKVTDDGIHSYFYRAHTAIVLIIVLSALAYTTFFEDHTIHEHDWEYNTKRGISWACFVFIAFGITQARDGPFMRPHPAIWRLVLCTSVLYLLFMVFLLFQSASNARNLMKYFDPEIGEPLNFTSYGHDCDIYDKNNPEDPFHNVKHKMDGFVAAHIIGWTMKTVMMRDFWLANIISILFELCEYSLEHQLANFSECWWDHWIMDFLVCNLSGIFIGMWIVRYLEGKEYNWRGLYKHPTTRGKVSRIIGQFSPHSWVSFQWNVTQSLKNFLLIMLIIVLYLLTEINTFYLKYVLWIPAGHAIVLIRLQIFILWGAVSTREIYDWSVGEANTIGQQFWVYSSCLFCECLIIYKFGYETLKQPFPDHIRQGWTWFFGLLIVYMIYKFQIRAGHVKPGSVEEKEAIKAGELDPKATVRLGLSESPASSDNGREKLRQRKKQ